MSKDIKLGNLIDGTVNRDAIHIAIAPVTCDSIVRPGQHLSLAHGSVDKTHVEGDPVGIVDPFLTSPVPIGTRFWLCLYPQTVTSLRHEWTHPAFASPALSPVEMSKAWLAKVAAQCGVSYERMMHAVASDDYINMGENETYKHTAVGSDEFKHHCEIVLGRTFEHAPYPFSCSC